MRKLTLGRFPDMGIMEARREAAAMLARFWAGEDVAPPHKVKPPLFKDFPPPLPRAAQESLETVLARNL